MNEIRTEDVRREVITRAGKASVIRDIFCHDILWGHILFIEEPLERYLLVTSSTELLSTNFSLKTHGDLNHVMDYAIQIIQGQINRRKLVSQALNTKSIPINRINYSSKSLLKRILFIGRYIIGFVFIIIGYLILVIGCLPSMFIASRAFNPFANDKIDLVSLGLVALVGVVVAMCGLYLYRIGMAIQIPTENEARQFDGRQPILYLRSFNDDFIWFPIDDQGSISKNPIYNAVINPILIIKYHRTFEELISNCLRRRGPVLALSNPIRWEFLTVKASRVPTITKGDKWKSKVRSLINESQMIVVVAGMTKGLEWEILQLIDSNTISKTLIIFPPSEDKLMRYHYLKKIFLSFGGLEWPSFIEPDTKAIRFSQDGFPIFDRGDCDYEDLETTYKKILYL